MSSRLEHGDLAVLDVLREAQGRGFIGAGPVTFHRDHSRAFARLVPSEPRRAVDLGSGAGLPGLVLAGEWPSSRWTLLEVSTRRAEFLRWAVDKLGLAERVGVLCQRAEVAGHDPAWRGHADVVVARSFGPPAVTAECGAAFLRVGGSLVVAEPPGRPPDRWSPEGLELLGLVLAASTTTPWAFQRLALATACPDRFPRRPGIPRKRPLW
jgi:16S rRNA (guanine527-N7)-methyltransferase